MAVFSYQACPAGVAGTSSPAVLRGTITADSPRHARELLRERELDVIAVDQVRRPLGLGWLKGSLGRRSNRYEARVVVFVRELSTLLAVGTPMLQALDTAIGPQTVQPQGKQLRWNWLDRASGFDAVLLELRDRVAAGAALSEAMGDHPDVFDALTLRLVEVGEKSGTLESVLDKLAGFKERSASFRGRLTNAMIYPAIVLTMAFVVTILLMTF
ncbi:MAG: type II secretion system F family protein, partial [Phycisphaeraceae bacterium]|nr:type II secretion system F family protein [Phycisphaeraceae bacterium]